MSCIYWSGSSRPEHENTVCSWHHQVQLAHQCVSSFKPLVKELIYTWHTYTCIHTTTLVGRWVGPILFVHVAYTELVHTYLQTLYTLYDMLVHDGHWLCIIVGALILSIQPTENTHFMKVTAFEKFRFWQNLYCDTFLNNSHMIWSF